MNTTGKSPRPVIECTGNGPYIVKNLEALSDSKGKAVATQAVIALCRCGGSANKPFCDGTHTKNGFSGENLADRSPDQRTSYVGKRITIHDNRAICAHAGHCTDRLPTVWRMGMEPWIDADGAEIEAIVETIEKCPSGALSYTIDSAEYRDQDREPAVRIAKDGPYRVTGGIELQGTSFAQGASQEHYTLCRCGGSKNKPFCDGSHWHIKFQDDEN